jgi:hypothetical protein
VIPARGQRPALRPGPGQARAEPYVQRHDSRLRSGRARSGSTVRRPGAAGTDLAHSRDLRFARRAHGPAGPAAAPPATGSRRLLGGAGGATLALPARAVPVGRSVRGGQGGKDVVPRPLHAPQSGKPNTRWAFSSSPRAIRCRRMNLPCRDSVSRAEIETTGLSQKERKRECAVEFSREYQVGKAFPAYFCLFS